MIFRRQRKLVIGYGLLTFALIWAAALPDLIRYGWDACLPPLLLTLIP